jgi:hypothetical protein
MQRIGEMRQGILSAAIGAAFFLGLASPVNANINVSPKVVNFPNQAVGSTSKPVTLTITNHTSRKLEIERVFASAGEFSFSGPRLPVTLLPGQSLTGSVTFAPPGAQSYRGALTFTPSRGSGVSVALRGTGYQVSPQPSLSQSPIITTQPAGKAVTAGQTATFNVAATGTSPMSFQWKKDGALVSGATSSVFTTPPTTTSGSGAQLSVVVSNTAGSVTSNAATLTVNPATALLNANTTSLSFGRVTLSSGSTQSVTLRNGGTSSVIISTVSISGAGFNVSGVPAGTILTPGQTAVLNVTFAPAATGSMTGGIAVASNASNSPAAIALSGTGAAQVSHSVALTWNPSASTVIGYNAYSSAVPGGSFVKLNPTPMATSSYTDTTVQSGKTYYYVVTAVDSSNNESNYSNQVSATIP